MTSSVKKYLPFLLTIIVIIADQFSKILVVQNIPIGGIGLELGGDFIRIIHVRNTAMAFSLFDWFPYGVKMVVFIIIPLLLLLVLMIYYIKGENFSFLQRWSVAGIIGGGIGNIIDRIVHDEGVVDFIDVKFYGLLGFDRWPTFNIADSAVVVCAFLLLISLILGSLGEKKPEMG